MKKTVAIVGGGPSALLLAAHLDTTQFDVSIYEKNAAPGRKFLVAGQGGFNLTHSEGLETFIKRYTPPSFLRSAIEGFTNKDLRAWLAVLGIETYTGTSKRVFPVKGTKPVEVLNAILKRLKDKGIELNCNYSWKGFGDTDELLFETPNGEKKVVANTVIFALGGGSWKITGSDGSWMPHFEKKEIHCLPFQPSNCAFGIAWPDTLKEKITGKALKNCCFSCGEKEIKGEAVLTQFGIEGSGVYPLSGEIRKQLHDLKKATLTIDLKTDLSEEEIKLKIKKNKTTQLTRFLETELNLSKHAIHLLKHYLTKEEFISSEKLSTRIKKLELQIDSLAPIDEAISTVGGIDLSEITPHFELKKFPGHYVIGEMLNWDAPTGGYLLQGCFSMGHYVAHYLNSGSK